MIRHRTGGTLVTPTRFRLLIAGVLRSVQSVRVKHDGELRTVFTATSSLSLSLSQSSISVEGGSSITTPAVTATPSGGVGPYSYAWTELSDDGTTSANTPSSATTTFTSTGLIILEPVGASYRCTVTDSLGATATADVLLSFTRTS